MSSENNPSPMSMRKIEMPRGSQVDALGEYIRDRMAEIKDELVEDLSEKDTAIRRGRYAELEELIERFSFPKGIEP